MSETNIIYGCVPLVTPQLFTTFRRLYWSEAGSSSPRIASSERNGSSVSTLVSGPTSVSEPLGITIDFVTKRLYWADAGNNSIHYVTLDDNTVETLVTSLSESPFQVAVDGDFVIWTQTSSIDFKYVDRRSPGDVYTSFLQEPQTRSFTLFGVIVINGNRRPGSGEGSTHIVAFLKVHSSRHVASAVLWSM